MSLQTIDPTSEKVLNHYEFDVPEEVERFVQASADAFSDWHHVSLERRLECVKSFEQVLSSGRSVLSDMMTAEMGKTLKDSLSEIDKCIASCKTLRERFPLWSEQNNYQQPNGYSVWRQPLGVVLGIMPWNYPLWQVVRFAIPALLNGNTILLKHAPNTWGSAELIGEFFAQAFPENVYLNLKVDVPAVGRLLQDARVRGVSLTGSRQAGISVAQQAAQNLKKCVLELGGSDAYVVLDDADLELSAEICVQARLVNVGQSCVAAKRFIVTKKNEEAFCAKMRQLMGAKKFADPRARDTDCGPLARQDLRARLHQQVKASVSSGAELVLGGEIPNGVGFFYPATVLRRVRPGQPAFDQELFGPVAVVIRAEDERQALQLANLSPYGLGGAIFSRDVKRAERLAREELQVGMVAVNDFVRSDASAPFGGMKDSGLGRELGREGCFEFTNIKSVYLKT